MKSHKISQAPIPMRHVGPISITGPVLNEKIAVPLATYETPLWPSVGRGARVSTLTEGIKTTVIDERMSRSILLEADDAEAAMLALNAIKSRQPEINEVVAQSSRFACLIAMHSQIVANLIYLRLEFTTGDASGHNMVTNAADKIIPWILQEYPQLRYSSISGNYCSDKKATAVNGILGRGKYVVSEMTISRELCQRRLKTTPEKVVDLNIKKNLIGTMVAAACAVPTPITPICYWPFIWQRGKMRLISSKVLKVLSTLKFARATCIFPVPYPT